MKLSANFSMASGVSVLDAEKTSLNRRRQALIEELFEHVLVEGLVFIAKELGHAA